MNRITKALLLASGLLIAFSSQAELKRVGPSDLPSPPGHGYPLWYQDTSGLALDLCVPQTLNQLDACLATPAPGDPLPTLPYSFPGNWSDEFFWFGAEALMDLPGGSRALLVQAVEAAFGLGPPAAGDQIAFARIRIVMDAPVDGNYTITFPYGNETFTDIKAGKRAIFFTSDIGLGAPGVFTGALKGAVGPFLTAVENDGVTPKPYFMIDGDTFLSDPLVTTKVTGAPFQNNYFEICTDNPNGMGGVVNGAIVDCVRTDMFALIGKVHTAPIASPLAVSRATYATHPGMPEAHLDVFATAEAGPNAAAPDLTVGAVGAPSAQMIGPRTPGGHYYAQSVVPVGALPNSVTVINSADVPASSIEAALVDSVTITAANYDAGSRVLTITAQSSDGATPPALAALGIPGSLTGSDLLTNGSLSMTLPPGTVPPETVTVVSDAGGSATVATTMPTHSAAFPTGAPLAVSDQVSTGEGAAANFAVLANDGAEAVASSLSILTIPTNGTATVNILNGSVDYVPVAGFFGADSFRYTVSNALGQSSNVATVAINVIQINDAPVANDDLAAAPGLTTSVTIDVTANDTDADGIAPAPGGLDPASVAIASVAAGGSATANGDGTVTFTKLGCETTASCSFTYTVSDNGVPALSSALATVTIETGSNQLPTANADAASVLVDRSVTIDVAANDSDPDGTLNLASILVTAPPANGSALANADGTITFGAGPNAGTVTFGYTIADNLGDRSSQATVTVTVNPNPDILSIQRKECRAGKDEWRVDGSSSILAPHSVTIYAGATIGGAVLEANIPVDNLGSWRMSKNSGACINRISIESSLGGKLENVFIPVN